MSIQALSSLLPAVAGRKATREANDLARRAYAVETGNRERNNRTTAARSDLEAFIVSVNSREILRGVAKERAAHQRNTASQYKQQVQAETDNQISAAQQAGMQAAQQALQGITGTPIADTINIASAFRQAEITGNLKDQREAIAFNSRQTEIGLLSAAFSSLPATLPIAQLDYRQSQLKLEKELPAWRAWGKDIGRLVATYFGGEQAAKAIDQVEGYEAKQAAREHSLQQSLNSIYGDNAPQLVQHSRPNLIQFVGMARGMGGGAKAAPSGTLNGQQALSGGFSGAGNFLSIPGAATKAGGGGWASWSSSFQNLGKAWNNPQFQQGFGQFFSGK